MTPGTSFDVDAGYRYMNRLRGSPLETNEPGWTVDWADAPWPFKIYDGGRRIPLPAVGPAWGPAIAAEEALLGRTLQLSSGCTCVRICPDGANHSSPERLMMNRSATLIARRAIASGGALYPAEVYVCGAGEALPGIYHYDPARHELVELAAELDARVPASLGLPASEGRTVFVVTDLFWKSFCKYGDFAYRLSAVDVGIAASRLHRLAQAELGESTVCFDFDDAALDGALGVDGADENAYAAIVVARPEASGDRTPARAPWRAPVTLPAVKQRSKRIKRSRSFDEMHASAFGDPPRSCGEEVWRALPPAAASSEIIPLPPVAPITGLQEAIFRRTSNGELFTGRGVSAEALSGVLAEAAAAVARVRGAAPGWDLPRPTLWVVVQRVAGIPAGAYLRDATGGLVPVRRGELGPELQAHSNLHNINLDLSAFTMYVADWLDLRCSPRGNRTYRIQQMIVGAAVDGAMLACAALRLGCHPMLGFNAAGTDALFGLADTGHGTLAQVCVGVSRRGLQLEGSVAA